jgi:hypothetical protein
MDAAAMGIATWGTRQSSSVALPKSSSTSAGQAGLRLTSSLQHAGGSRSATDTNQPQTTTYSMLYWFSMRQGPAACADSSSGGVTVAAGAAGRGVAKAWRAGRPRVGCQGCIGNAGSRQWARDGGRALTLAHEGDLRHVLSKAHLGPGVVSAAREATQTP